MVCIKCQGLMVKEYDNGYSRFFHIYQDRCLNCGHVIFDPKTVDKPITKEVLCEV